VQLGSRALEILCVLASAKGAIVSKDELLAKVWADRVVEENALQVHVSALRKALDQAEDGQSYVVTVPGRGYRLAAIEQTATREQVVEGVPFEIPGTSIAVLPFQNMSGDPEQEYFADGMVEDIITGLSRIKWLFVIARNSSFVYKGHAVDIKQVGRELGVRYVLEGSVRKAGNRVRITAQLLETQTGVHMWAERYDRLLDDIFAVQDEVTMSVIGAIEPSLRKAEIERVKRKRPDSLDAYDLVLRALPYQSMPESAAVAIPLLEKALQLEPGYAFAHACLAMRYHVRFSRGGLREADRTASIHHARAAIAGGTDDATTLALAAFVIWLDEHDAATAFELFDRALAVSSSNVEALRNSAFALAWMGKTELAIERAKRALRVSPFDTAVANMAIAVAKFQAGQFDEAYAAARRAVEAHPTFSVPHVLLAVALCKLGRMDQARQEAERVLALDSTFTMRRFSVTVGYIPDVFARFAAAWSELEMPEN
jgi:TolB-like protein/Tfp pilus assembly protein PilF